MGIKTVKRVFSSIRAIVNLAIAEEGLECSNAFARTYFPNDDNAQLRQPISIEDIKKVQSLCRENDDEMRWLIALISDTGMRLGEAAGLLKEDIKLDDRIPLSNSTLIAKPIRTSNPVQRITKVVKVYE